MAFPGVFVLPQHTLPVLLHPGKEGCQRPLPPGCWFGMRWPVPGPVMLGTELNAAFVWGGLLVSEATVSTEQGELGWGDSSSCPVPSLRTRWDVLTPQPAVLAQGVGAAPPALLPILGALPTKGFDAATLSLLTSWGEKSEWSSSVHSSGACKGADLEGVWRGVMCFSQSFKVSLPRSFWLLAGSCTQSATLAMVSVILSVSPII